MKTKKILEGVAFMTLLLLAGCSTGSKLSRSTDTGNEGRMIGKNIDLIIGMYRDSFSEVMRNNNMLVVIYKDPLVNTELTPENAARLLGGFSIASKLARSSDVLIVGFMNGADQVTAYYVQYLDFRKFLDNRYTPEQLAEKINVTNVPMDSGDYSFSAY